MLLRLLLVVVGVAVVQAHGGGGGGNSSATGKRPSFIYLMADDLNADWKSDRLAYMRSLDTLLVQKGAYFRNHVAAVPVCGPSRSSMLLGRFPHNHKYKMNDDIQSVKAFIQRHNNTIGKWLSDAGYYTGFLGKYVNSCEGSVPHGWAHWGGFLQTYNFYNASMYDMEWENPSQPGGDPPVKVKVMTGVHQVDFLGNETLDLVDRATAQGKPFFVSVTPVTPHWGTCYGPLPESEYAPTDPYWEFNLVDPATGKHYSMPTSPCPTVRHAHAFDGQNNPHIPAVWNKTIVGPEPEFMNRSFPGLDDYQTYREDIGFRNRSASLLDLDHLINVIVSGLEERGLMDSTYVIFTSDNGYHLGEHAMPFGKGEPYETDIRLPAVIRGPGVAQGVNMTHLTNHMDITATIVDLAGAKAHAPSDLDGKSFASELLSPNPDPVAWRAFSFSEFFASENTWQMVRVVNATHTLTVHRWCTADLEVYNLNDDPWQTTNLAGRPGLAQRAEQQWIPVVAALGYCVGANCSSTKTLPPETVRHSAGAAVATTTPALACYPVRTMKDARIGSWNFQLKNGKVVGLHGWAVDFTLDPGTPQRPLGSSPSTVRLLLDSTQHPHITPDQVANISRPDIVPIYQLPNPYHGFEFDFPEGFVPTKNKHSFQVVAIDKGPGGHEHVVPLCSKCHAKCICDLAPCDC